ncbi:hypothetical protein V8E36_001622 [Tilletia maclaganii]
MDPLAQIPAFSVQSSDTISEATLAGRRRASGSQLVRALARKQTIAELDTRGAGPYGPVGEIYILEALKLRATSLKLPDAVFDRIERVAIPRLAALLLSIDANLTTDKAHEELGAGAAYGRITFPLQKWSWDQLAANSSLHQSTLARIAAAEHGTARYAANFQATNRITELQLSVTELDKRLAEMRAEADAMRKERDIIREESDATSTAAAEKVVDLEADLIMLRKDLDEAGQIVKGLQHGRNQARREIEELPGDRSRARSELEELHGELEQARQELDHARREINQAQREHNQNRLEVKKLQGELRLARQDAVDLRTKLAVTDKALQDAQQLVQKAKEVAPKHPLLAPHPSIPPPAAANAWSPRAPAPPDGFQVPSRIFDIAQDSVDRSQCLSFMRGPGRYHEQHKIGSGSQGHVFVARDRLSPTRVAVKAVATVSTRGVGTAAQPCFPDSLWRELGALARVRHPNVVQLLGVVLTNDAKVGPCLSLVMEYAPSDLLQVMQHQVPPIEVCKPWGYQMLTGIAALHALNLVHLDIKPSNILVIVEGTVKVADLGLAEDTRGPHPYFRMLPVGTRWYRAPEALLRATEIDPAFDTWGWGVTYAELLTGRQTPLFRAKDPISAMNLIVAALLPASDSTHAAQGPFEPWRGAHRLPGALGPNVPHNSMDNGVTRFPAGEGPENFWQSVKDSIGTEPRVAAMLVDPLVQALEMNPLTRPSAKALARDQSWAEGLDVTVPGYRPPKIQLETRYTCW